MTVEQKRYLDRASRAMRELRKEKQKYGQIHDGSGKRYLAGLYFLLGGDVRKSAEAFDWFYEEFPDDVGEPIQHLYASLAAFRIGALLTGEKRLKEAMLSNIYLLPRIIQAEINTEGVWHSSNWAREEYLDEVGEFLEEPSAEERAWIAEKFSSTPFCDLLNGYIETCRALNTESVVSRRSEILNKWRLRLAEKAN